MNNKTLDILLNNFPKVCSEIEKNNCLNLIWYIFKCINQSKSKGIGTLDEIILEIPNKYQLLKEAMYLIAYAIEPIQLEEILLNYIIFTNNSDLSFLECVVIIEGSLLIQKKEDLLVSKEILKSYFGLDFKIKFDNEYEKIKRKLEFKEISKLTKSEIEILLRK